MAIYRASIASELPTAQGGASSGASIFEIVGSATDYMLVKNIGLINAGGNNAQYWFLGLGYTSSVGSTPAVSVPFLPDDPSQPPTLAYVASAWMGPGPGAPSGYLRRTCVPGTIVTPCLWRSPRGIGLNPGTSLGIFTVATCTTLGQLWIDVEIDV